METYYNCKTFHTGLYKPHTIQVNNIKISIVYYEKSEKGNNIIAIAHDTQNNIYDIVACKSVYGNDGLLAFPQDAKSIKGFFPWL